MNRGESSNFRSEKNPRDAHFPLSASLHKIKMTPVSQILIHAYYMLGTFQERRDQVMNRTEQDTQSPCLCGLKC